MTNSEQDKRFLWHPFTQMRAWTAEEPLMIESGQGVMLRDTQGREYYDANSSLWVNLFGHCNPEIDAAVIGQLSRIAHSTMLGLSHPLAAEVAEQLIRVAPRGLKRVFYSDSGSEANEIAIKMAYRYWQHRGEAGRHWFIALTEGYHGDTVGAVSVGGIGVFHSIFRKLLFDVVFAPSPRGPAAEAAEHVEALLVAHRGEVCAVIMEPLIQAAGGMLLQPPGFLARVRELCTRYKVLLIVDEVATGFGRTGTMFACEQESVTPDIMTLAKGLTGGYLPLAATLTTTAVYNEFLGEYSESKTFYHGHSYTGNPLACAAALATLYIFESEHILAGLPAKVAHIARELAKLRKLDHVLDIRQCGLMCGIEIGETAPPRPYAPELQMGARVCKRARSMGLITRPLGDVVIFLPPLSSTDFEIKEMLLIIGEAIDQETSHVPA